MESSAGADIGEKQDSRGTSGSIIGINGNPDENVEAKRVTRSKGKCSNVQSGLNISTEADGKQGTKRKRSSVKSSPAQPIVGSNELSHGTKIAGKDYQDQAYDSYDAQPEKESAIKKSSLRKRGRKSNANSLPKDLSGRTEKKKISEKKSKLDSCSVPSKVTQLRGKKILSDELNSTNKKKSTMDESNHNIQVLEKCSTVNKRTLEGSVLLRRCDGPPTNKFTCAFCQSSEDTEVFFTISH